MTSNITVSSDIARISDLVALRQMTPVPREQVEALVKMVLECAAEAVPAKAPGLRYLTGRVDRVVDEGDRSRAFLIVDKTDPLDNGRRSPLTPALTTTEGREMADRLKKLVGQSVVIGVRHEPADRPGWKRLIVRDVRPADERR